MGISWDVGATLEKATVRRHVPRQYAITGTSEVWHGTLGGAVREWLAKPDSQKPLYSILTEKEAGTGKTILDWRDIEALAKSPDFPVTG